MPVFCTESTDVIGKAHLDLHQLATGPDYYVLPLPAAESTSTTQRIYVRITMKQASVRCLLIFRAFRLASPRTEHRSDPSTPARQVTQATVKLMRVSFSLDGLLEQENTKLRCARSMTGTAR